MSFVMDVTSSHFFMMTDAYLSLRSWVASIFMTNASAYPLMDAIGVFISCDSVAITVLLFSIASCSLRLACTISVLIWSNAHVKLPNIFTRLYLSSVSISPVARCDA